MCAGYQQNHNEMFRYFIVAFSGWRFGRAVFRGYEFFRHTLEFLPVDYFSELQLRRNLRLPQRCPLETILHFLYLLPSGTLSQAAPKERWTKFILGGHGSINVNELRAILSHQLRWSTRLEFDYRPFDTSISLAGMLDLAKGAPYFQLFEVEDARGGHSLQVTIKSSALSWHADGFVGPELLKAISKTSHVHSVDIDFGHLFRNSDEEERREIIGRLVHPFLDGSLKTESLQVRFEYSRNERLLVPYEYDLYEMSDEEKKCKRVCHWVTGALISCKSKDLCTFNASIVFSDNKKRLSEDFGPSMWCDSCMFPVLVLNYCDAKLTKALSAGALPLAIGAINQGHIYHRTTGHNPCDMNIANAGLLFRFLKRQVVTRPGFCGNQGDVSPIVGCKVSAQALNSLVHEEGENCPQKNEP
jgi:hypothetical protein